MWFSKSIWYYKSDIDSEVDIFIIYTYLWGLICHGYAGFRRFMSDKSTVLSREKLIFFNFDLITFWFWFSTSLCYYKSEIDFEIDIFIIYTYLGCWFIMVILDLWGLWMIIDNIFFIEKFDFFEFRSYNFFGFIFCEYMLL